MKTGVRLEREVGKLRKGILEVSALVENRLHLAVKSAMTRDAALARTVIDGDQEIDFMEVDLEEDCLKALALYQPVAVDLRYIVAILKINNDLERIGDLAVNIADRAEMLAALPPCEVPFDFTGMADQAQRMLRNSRDALVEMDLTLAHEVIGADEEIDAANRGMYVVATEAMRKNPDHIDRLLLLLGISRLLERVADHATNIAEDVIYTATGKIVRHRPGEA